MDRRGGASGRWRWLVVVEAAWYVAVLAARVLGPEGGAAGRRTEFFHLAGLGALCATLALVRWWRPGWTAAIAAVVLTGGILVVVTRPPGPLAPLRLLMSLALTPILLVATVRAARLVPAAAVVALAAVAGLVDAAFYGNTFSVNLSRSLLELFLPDRGVVLLSAGVALLGPVALGLVLRSGDVARREAALARRRAEERRRAAADLHDLVSGHVTGMILTAQAASTRPDLGSGARTALRAVEDGGQRALDAMHRMVTELRASDGADGADGVAAPGGVSGPRTVAEVLDGGSGAARGLTVRVDERAARLVVDDAVADALDHVVTEGARRRAPSRWTG